MRNLVIRDLVVIVDGHRNDPVGEAREVITAINAALVKLSGDPVLDFGLSGTADIDAEYIDEEEDDG